MAQRYRQKELDPPTGFPPWEMEAMEHIESSQAEILAWATDAAMVNGKLMLYGNEIPIGSWIIKNTANGLCSPATPEFPQYHDPI
jgi:hypothetical protein